MGVGWFPPTPHSELKWIIFSQLLALCWTRGTLLMWPLSLRIVRRLRHTRLSSQLKSIFSTYPQKQKKQVQPSTDLQERSDVKKTNLLAYTKLSFLSKHILSQSKWKLGPYKFVYSNNMAIASTVLLVKDSTQRTVILTLIVTKHYAH